MIGIKELDNLSEQQMIDVLNNKLRVYARDPTKIQLSVESTEHEPSLLDPYMLSEEKIKLLIKMELKQRLQLIYLREKILGEKT